MYLIVEIFDGPVRLKLRKVVALESSWETPYVRVILLVQATGPCVRKRGSELIFRATQIRLKEVHIIRGYDFEDRGDKYCNLTKENVTELLSVTPITYIR